MGIFSALDKWWNTVDDPNVLKQYERRMDDWYNDPFRKESSRPVAPPMCTPGRECQPTGMYRNEFNAVPEAPEVVEENRNHRKKRQRELENVASHYGHSEHQAEQQRNTPRASAWRKYAQPEQRHEFNPGRGSAPVARNVGYPVQVDQPIAVPNWPQRKEQSIMDKMMNGVQED